MKRTFLFLTLLVAAITVWADALDDALSKLPGVVSVKTLESADGVAKRVVMFEQPLAAVDAEHGIAAPEGETADPGKGQEQIGG